MHYNELMPVGKQRQVCDACIVRIACVPEGTCQTEVMSYSETIKPVALAITE